MVAFRKAGHERINAFLIGNRYLFKHYFEDAVVFDRVKRYYNNSQYRFEVPASEFDDLRGFLAEHGFGLVSIDVLDPFVVVVRKYTDHPDAIFRDSVIHRGIPDYNCFLMKSRAAVERATGEGAVPIEETPLEHPFDAE